MAKEASDVCCYRCTQQLPAVWDDGSFIWVIYIVNDIFGGVRTGYKVKNGTKLKSMIDCLGPEDVSELQDHGD